jgi:hypothetical protein
MDIKSIINSKHSYKRTFMNKNIALFVMLFAASSATVSSDTFQPKNYMWTWTLQAKNGSEDLQTFSDLNDQMRVIIDGTKRGADTNVYEQFLAFLSQAQQAILSGLNLIGLVQSNETTLEAMLEEVASDVVEDVIAYEEQQFAPETAIVAAQAQVSDEPMTPQDETNAAVCKDEINPAEPMVQVLVSCSAHQESDLDMYNQIKDRLNTLGASLNAGQATNEDVVETLKMVYELVKQMDDATICLLAQ